jgi:hypothetical protein
MGFQIFVLENVGEAHVAPDRQKTRGKVMVAIGG